MGTSMTAAKMICVVPEAVAGTENEEPAYPDSILDDPQTREQFRAIYIEQDEEPDEEAPKLGFWKRQFSETATAKQKRFDWLFSVILPVICFTFDPFVFRSYGVGPILLASFAPVAIPLSYAAVMATMIWLLMGKRLGWINTLLSGVFAICSVASLAIGVVLFPFSAVGIFVIIGLLGFTPLLMSFSLWRNAVRAYRAAHANAGN